MGSGQGLIGDPAQPSYNQHVVGEPVPAHCGRLPTGKNSLRQMLGRFPPSLLGKLHTNRFGVIPKGYDTRKWHLITDLSFPPGQSVNDNIDPVFCSLSYTTVDKVIKIVSELSPGALLAKLDIESSYTLVSAHLCDRHLQAVQWEDKYTYSWTRRSHLSSAGDQHFALPR